MRKIILFLSVFLLVAEVFGGPVHSITSGNWSSTATWNTGVVPPAGSAVTITAGNTVTLDQNVTGANAILTLAVNGTLQIGSAVSSFTLSTTGAITFAATGILEANPSLNNSSTPSMLNAGGNITLVAGSTMNMYQSGGNSVCDVTITNTSTLSGGAITFNNLTINPGAGKTVTVNNSETISGSLTASSGTMANAANNQTVTGDAIVSSGATISFTTGQLIVTNNITSAGTITFTGAGKLTANGVINNSGGILTIGTATLSASVITNNSGGRATVSTGKFEATGTITNGDATNGIQFTGAGTFTCDDLENTGKIVFLTTSPSIAGPLNNSGTITATSGSIVLTGGSGNFTNSGGSVTITTTGGISISGTSTISGGTVSLATGTYTSTGDMTINGTLAFTGAGGALSIAGNFTNDGVFTEGTSTTTFNGSTTQTISGTSTITFDNVVISTGGPTVQLGALVSSMLTVNGTLLLTSGTLDVGSANNEISIGGTFTNNATFNAEQGLINFTNTANIAGTSQTTFYDLTITPGAGKTVTVTGTHIAPNEIISDNLSITSGTLAIVATTCTVSNDVTITGTLSFTTGTLNVAGSFTDNGTFTQGTGTVVMNGSAAQTIGGTTATAFYSLTISNSTTVTLSNAITVGKNLDITTGKLDCSTNAITGNAVGTFTMAAGTTFILGSTSSAAIVAMPNFNAYVLNASSTVDYECNAPAGAWNVLTENAAAVAISYGNLNLYTGASASSCGLSASNNYTVAGNLTVGDGVSAGTVTFSWSAADTKVLTVNGNVLINSNGEISFASAGAASGLTIKGNFTNDGTFLPGTVSTVDFNGTSNESISGSGAVSFYNLTIDNTGAAGSNTVTIGNVPGASITVSNTLLLSLGGGIFDVGPSNNEIICGATFNDANTTQAAAAFNAEQGTVEFNGATGTISGAQSVTFYNVTCAATGAVTVTGTHVAPTEIISNNLLISSGSFAPVATTIDVGGNFTNNSTFTQGASTIIFNGSTTQTIGGTGTITFDNLTISGSGTVQLGEAITVSAVFTLTAGTFDVSTSNYGVTCDGNFTNNDATTAFNAENGMVTFGNTSTIGGTSSTKFYDVNCSPGAGKTVTLGENDTISDNLTVSSGTFAITTKTCTVSNNVSITGTLSFTTGTLNIGGNFTNNGTYTRGTGTINFDGSSSSGQTITLTVATTFYNENVTTTVVDTVYLSTLSTNNLTIANNLDIASGSFHCQSRTLTGPGAAAGTFTMASGTTFLLGLKSSVTNSPMPTFKTYSFNAGSTVIYQAASAAQTILITPTYGNVNIYSGAASVIKSCSAAGILTVGGTLTVGDGIETAVVTFNASTHVNTINVSGDLDVNTDGIFTNTTNNVTVTNNVSNWKTISFSTGTFTVSGSVANNASSSITFTSGALKVTGSVVNSGTISFSLAASTFNITSNLTINSGGTVSFTGTATSFKVGGNFSNSGTLTPATTTTVFNGASTQTINGSSTTSFYAINVNGTNVVLGHNENATNSVTISSGTFDGGTGSYTFNVGGNFTNNATFTGDNGTVVMDGGAAQAINGSSSSTFYNLTIDPTGAFTTTLGIGQTINSNVTLTAGTLDVSASNYGLTVGGSFTNNASAAAFTARNGTVTMNGTGTIGGTASTTFYNLTENGSSPSITLGNNETVSKDFLLSTGTFDVSASNYSLTVGGNFTNDATFKQQQGTVTFNGAGTQNITGTVSTTFYNATMSGSNVALNLNTSLQNSLTVTSGTLSSVGTDSLTMISNALLTARIANVALGASITAPLIMQRYVAGNKANYRSLASPSQGSTLHDWAYDAGFYMSGVGGPDGNATSGSGIYYSVYTYDEPTSSYVAVTSTGQPLTPCMGLFIFVGTNLTTLNPFTFATHGTPNYGTINTYSVTDNGSGNNLIGNPYYCPISWTSFHSTNSGILGASFSIYDETTNSWDNSNGVTGTGVLAANPNIIPSHQGFMVTATSGNTITFNEAHKLSSSDQALLSGITPDPDDFIRINVTTDANTYSNNAIVQFDSGAKETYSPCEDALYLSSISPGALDVYTVSSDGRFLTRNTLPTPAADGLDIPFYAGGSVNGNYTLTFTGISKLTKYNCVQLEDVKTGKLVQIEEGGTYTFPLPQATKLKFILHFKKLQPGENCKAPERNLMSLNGNNAVDIFHTDEGAEVRFTLNQSEQAVISVYNTMGEKVEQDITKDVMDEQVNVQLPLANAIYIIRVELPGSVTTNKVFH